MGAAPSELLRSWIGRRPSPEAVIWFESKQADLARDPAPRAFASVSGLVSRRMGKADLDLEPSDLTSAEQARSEWRPAGLTIEQAARIVLLIESAKASGSFVERLKSLTATADLGELIAIYKGLPLYPNPETLVPVATEGLRKAMRAVFEAAAYQNPFPSEHFPQSAWNHMVLKTLFIDSVLHPIIGLDRRWNEELTEILVNYAQARRAAHRPVSPELWRGVGPFAGVAAIADLGQVLAEGDELEQKAAALALSASRHPAAAEALARRRDLDRQRLPRMMGGRVGHSHLLGPIRDRSKLQSCDPKLDLTTRNACP
jgi:hypothetical protein